MPDTYPLPLGPYTLFREIGRGGFATVYLARDEQKQRDVALKVLDPKLAGDPEFLKRFEQEFKLAARLDHPHIVKAFDYGEANGQFYIAMTLVRGFDLRTRIRETGALSVSQALHYAKQIADALDYAHAQGIIHRDVKSANILLNEDGNALLSDFGLMRAVEKSSYMTAYSRSQEFVGTAEYISPEQANGGETTARSDLYSFGVVVYEMLTGQVPFHSDNSVVLVRMHADNPPPNPLDLRNDLPPALVNELLHALAKRPADRPAGAVVFVNAMQNALNAEQQAAAAKTAKLLGLRESVVAQSRARMEQITRQKEEAERARLLAEREAEQLETMTTETETLLKELKTEEEKARLAAADAEKARRAAEERSKTAQARLARAEKVLEGWQGVDAAIGAEEEIRIELTSGVEMVLVHIPAGEFAMGSEESIDGLAQSPEIPWHNVYLDEYWMGRYPVTVAQYWAFANETNRQSFVQSVQHMAQHPITQVSWDDAVAFCEWVSKKRRRKFALPTEAQWEKAARGMDGRIYPWGNDPPEASRCNFTNAVKDTTPVGKYSPHGDSLYGCADMAGNVWEWCADWYNAAYYRISPDANPEGAASGSSRIVRGGSFRTGAAGIRCAVRHRHSPQVRRPNLGFRIVALVKPLAT